LSFPGFAVTRFVKELPPQFQLFRFAAGVKNGQDHDALFFDEKMNHNAQLPAHAAKPGSRTSA
jgi:hypothetical protein